LQQLLAKQGVDPARFERVPFLQKVHSDDTMDVYRVAGQDAPARPDPAQFSGLDCRSGAA